MKTTSHTTNIIKRQGGFILTTELVLLSTIMLVGLIVGLTTMRDSVVAEMNDVADAIGRMNQGYAFDGVLMYDAHSSGQGSGFSDSGDAYAGDGLSFRYIAADGFEGTTLYSNRPGRYRDEPVTSPGTADSGAGGANTTDDQTGVEVITGTDTTTVVIGGVVNDPLVDGGTATDPVTGCKGKGNCDNGNKPGSEPAVVVDASVGASLDPASSGEVLTDPVLGVDVIVGTDTSLAIIDSTGGDPTLTSGTAAEPVTGCKGLGKCDKSVKL